MATIVPDQKWWEMRTVWSAVSVIVSLIAGVLGYSIGPEDQEQLTLTLTAVAVGVSGVLAMIFRIKAGGKKK